MIVPRTGVDDLGQPVEASNTWLKYQLALTNSSSDKNSLEIEREELRYIPKGDARQHLGFPHTREWLDSVVISTRRATAYISTDVSGSERVIKLHQEGGPGRARQHQAARLPRTVLSSVTAADGATVALARNELRSWRLLQLEPAALRRSDDFGASRHLGPDGSHLPATLTRLASGPNQQDVYRTVCNRLKELIDEVHDIRVERDERREQLSIITTTRDGTVHPARSLSDGTLRFLALAVLEQDPEASGLLCLEEPENGIHPERVGAMLRLLEGIAVDAELPLDRDNPLRQVVINTHSPAVVSIVAPDDILVAESRTEAINGSRTRGVVFSSLANTWRHVTATDPERARVCSVDKVLSYLAPGQLSAASTRGRLADRPEIREQLQLILPFGTEAR